MENEMLCVGDRVEEDEAAGARGTVRYVGPVATSKDAAAAYYGIEWDMWGRGLNDGSVVLPSGERVVYFQGPPGRKKRVVQSTDGASSTQNGALEFKCSFVKASKFKTKRSRTLIERLQERYGHAPSAAAPARSSIAPDVVITGEVGTTLGSQRPIELVGVEKLKTQQTLTTIEKISLAQNQIADLGFASPGDLKALTPNIRELNLAFNLFRTWKSIFRIVQELPEIETLILTGNRLVYVKPQEDAADGTATPEWRFLHVKTLVLNQTLVSWENLMALLDHHFPALVELYLVENEFIDADLELLVEGNKQKRPWMDTLEVLDLSQNHLRSWQKLSYTIGSTLVNLKQFVVNDNQICTLAGTTDLLVQGPPAFQQLRSLSINDNRIDSWTSIHALDQYPQLDTLRFTRNPLVARMGAGEARMILIARTDHIAAINGSGVRAKERQDAEQMYLKRVLHELAALGDTSDARASVLASHPRFDRLRQLYPHIQISFDGSSSGSVNGVSAGPAKLSSSLIQVKIIPMSMQATSFDPMVKKIPEKMKIAQLKVLVEKKFGVEAPSQLLSYRADSRSMPSPLDDDNTEIGYYGLQ
uniref:CAP-Gly domain-containing protein n=1 Tax=Globisporangium ultimum (strain ATCC 200006 / CBS 805.95 / DAOM BR144) TaxID=431595 RepID=K3W679_GLOUD